MVRNLNIIAFLVAVLAYQVTGWLLGERIFKSLNSEAMLFTSLLGGIGFVGWLLYKLDDSSFPPTRQGQIIFWGLVMIGVLLGTAVRVQME